MPGLVRGDYAWSTLEETSNFDRYVGNHMGSDAAGQSLANGLDFFWDGQGTGNCWQTARSDSVEPLTLSACGAGVQSRLLDDPNKLVLFGDCSNYDLPTQTLPPGCDWFDTPQRPGVLAASINIEAIAPTIQFGGLLLLFPWLLRRRGRPGVLALATWGAALLGSVLLLIGSAEQFSYLVPPGIAFLGIGWLGAVRLVPTRRLAFLTVLLGVVALLESVDGGLVQLPIPIGPVWVRLVLEVAWIVWTTVALVTAARTTPRPKSA